MLELRHDPLADLLALLGVYRLVRREGIEDSYSAPLGAFVQRHEELGEGRWVDDEEVGVGLGGSGRGSGVAVLVYSRLGVFRYPE
jgi:hypothetical protein